MTPCRSCGASIFWAWTKKGKRMPIDAEPNHLGNISLQGTTVRFVTPDANTLGQRYVSHFVTCPNADKHRLRDQVAEPEEP